MFQLLIKQDIALKICKAKSYITCEIGTLLVEAHCQVHFPRKKQSAKKLTYSKDQKLANGVQGSSASEKKDKTALCHARRPQPQ